MILQAIHDISAICAAKGVQFAVLSPGSRCAPLTISFARNKQIRKFTFSDERSAAFHALGMASATNSPVVLVCTSGSAAYNYAPAVAEAFYQQIPLLLLTAARPPEWVDQLDGQTIRQQNIYGNHVKNSYTLPDTHNSPEAYWHTNRIVNEAINCAQEFPKGPVHINVPIREPFYPTAEETPAFSPDIRIISRSQSAAQPDATHYADRISAFDKVLLVPGQQRFDDELLRAVNDFCDATHCTLIADVISNLHEATSAIRHQDLFLNSQAPLAASFQPTLLITFGKSLISKNLKIYLRQNPALEHWHIQEASENAADTFQHLTEVIKCEPLAFLNAVGKSYTHQSDFDAQKRENYRQSWSITDKRTGEILEEILETNEFNELTVVNDCLAAIPNHSALHLSNSMMVRYVNFVGLGHKNKVEVFCNRGTSGIDGSNSTAYGQALITDQVVTLITGDLAFFYDRNAFWNKYQTPNLRIILINNHGGGIFRMIPGPVALEELEDFFVTEQNSQATHVAMEFGFHHTTVNNQAELNRALPMFFHQSTMPKILEIKTHSEKSSLFLKSLKSKILQNLNS